ncbi:hypothetical protein GF351_01275 [Candidatus Woesearchaeota archaeon]|nr:hypothetical protein [Candidatus Woesearchaeota archaeon]
MKSWVIVSTLCEPENLYTLHSRLGFQEMPFMRGLDSVGPELRFNNDPVLCEYVGGYLNRFRQESEPHEQFGPGAARYQRPRVRPLHPKYFQFEMDDCIGYCEGKIIGTDQRYAAHWLFRSEKLHEDLRMMVERLEPVVGDRQAVTDLKYVLKALEGKDA